VVTSIAGESYERQEKRRQLTNQLDVLTQGSETCKRFIVGTLQGTYDVLMLCCYWVTPRLTNDGGLGTRSITILGGKSSTASAGSSLESRRTSSSELVTHSESEEDDEIPAPAPDDLASPVEPAPESDAEWSS
jgi:hypothetical protein